jgi:hypothetical protein
MTRLACGISWTACADPARCQRAGVRAARRHSRTRRDRRVAAGHRERQRPVWSFDACSQRRSQNPDPPPRVCQAHAAQRRARVHRGATRAAQLRRDHARATPLANLQRTMPSNPSHRQRDPRRISRRPRDRVGQRMDHNRYRLLTLCRLAVQPPAQTLARKIVEPVKQRSYDRPARSAATRAPAQSRWHTPERHMELRCAPSSGAFEGSGPRCARRGGLRTGSR